MQQFFYDGQIRRFLLQVSRIFSNFQVEYGYDDDGNVTYLRVPVRYGDSSRQAATIIQENSANSVPCAPLITFYINALTYRRADVQEPYFIDNKYIQQRQWNETEQRYEEIQGNAFTVERHMPAPWMLGITVDVWTTNTSMKLQILEQILTLFNPALEIQNTDNYLDWTSLSAMEIKDTSFSSRTVPNGTEDAIDIASLKFDLPIWLSMPARVTKAGVIHKVISSMYDEDGDLHEALLNDDLLLGTRVKVTPHGYQLLLIGNELQILRASNPSTVYNESLDPIPPQDSEVNWHAVIDEYGKLRNGISEIRLENPDGSEVYGTVSYHPTNDNVLIFNVDIDTTPSDTLAVVDAVINPLRSGPGVGLAAATTGQRYLLTEATGDITDTELASAWAGSSNTELVAQANDIIEYNGTEWTVTFNSEQATTIQYVTNVTTSLQYKWDLTSWVRSYEGIYTGGQWALVL